MQSLRFRDADAAHPFIVRFGILRLTLASSHGGAAVVVTYGAWMSCFYLELELLTILLKSVQV